MRFWGRLCETGQPATVTVEGARIAAVEPNGAGAGAGIGGEAVWIAPGFIDAQVNGYGGHDFNLDFWGQKEPQEEAISRIVELAARSGTAMLCPTICTNSAAAMIGGLEAIRRGREADARLARAIPAIHVEGPYLASEDGPRGAHPLDS